MESSGYTTLTRQSGLLNELQVIANNIANISTAGFRKEGILFSEHVVQLDNDSSLSMAYGDTRNVDLSQAGLTRTGGAYDLAIEGEGFFLLDTPNGQRLTRAGAFTPSADGALVSPDGYGLLDAGGAPVVIPQGAGQISVAQDGTLSANGLPLAQIGVWRPTDATTLRREAGTLFSADGLEPGGEAVIQHGFLEDSNVVAVSEIARMIEVQRAYELGQSFLETENERQQTSIQTFGR